MDPNLQEDLLRELHIILGTMKMVDVMKNLGLSREETIIAARSLIFTLEEARLIEGKGKSLTISDEEARAFSPTLHKFVQAEIVALKAKENEQPKN